ncbi:CinA family protein [Marinagarivorans algicola]|uniref:CinA family protein n=1 Tax=Marinagarivorans algicola TaxID=1513270 RepID=UPI0006B5C05B|nr:CinA family protein [Marinagarivorans algicola]
MLINNDLQQRVHTLSRALLRRQATVTTAESCTGGAVAATLTAVAGSSAWFDGGFITYSNRLKTQLLGVSTELIAQHGVVSEPVVKAMVLGACQQAQASYGISLSGIAGPDGGSALKPVGTICIAWGAPQQVIAHSFHFDGDRDNIREQAVIAALSGLTQYLHNTD